MAFIKSSHRLTVIRLLIAQFPFQGTQLALDIQDILLNLIQFLVQ